MLHPCWAYIGPVLNVGPCWAYVVELVGPMVKNVGPNMGLRWAMSSPSLAT